MGKVKIMLISIATLAIIAGIWAFKAKLTHKYCTAATVSGSDHVIM